MRPVPLLLAAVLVLGAAPADARAGELDADLAALRARTAQALEELAAWCAKQHVFGSRDDVYVELLRFDPDHAQARRKLRYERDEDGRWVQDERWRRARNLRRAPAKEAATRLEALLADHRRRLLARLAAAQDLGALLTARRVVEARLRREPAAEDLPPLLRELVMRTHGAARERDLVKEMADAATWLRDRYPEDEAVRSLLGETVHEGRWVLEETARSLAASARLHAFVEKAIAAAPVEPAAPFDREQAMDLPWQAGRQTPEVRVAGTRTPEVLESVARRAHAAGGLFERVFGRPPVRRAGLTAYLLAEKGQLDTLLAGHPVVANPTLEQREKLDLVYADARTLVCKANPPRAQTDLVVTETLNMLLADTFLGSSTPKGWHAEGLARYLSWLLTGTRLSIAVGGRYEGQVGDRHVPESGDPWLARARAYLKQPVDLELLLGKGTDVITARESVIAYAFSVYLVTGHDGAAAAFVERHAETKDVDRTCREVLGMSRHVALHRLTRWLDDMVALGAEAPKPGPKEKR